MMGALLCALTSHEDSMDLVYGKERIKVCADNGYKAGSNPTLKKIRCTCYIDSGITAGGKHTNKTTVAGCREWMGKTCALYAITETGEVKEFIGFFEFADTGAGIDTDGDGKGDSIKNGTSIDVWRPSLADANKWMAEYGDYVYMQILESRG